MEHADRAEVLARLRAARSVHQGEGADLAAVRPVAVHAPVVPVTPSPGTPRRTGRGHIASYGEARVCAVATCTTTLSRYNERDVCAIHAEDPRRSASTTDG